MLPVYVFRADNQFVHTFLGWAFSPLPAFLGCLQFFVQSWGSVFWLTGKTVSHGQLQLHALTATPPPLPDEYRRMLPLKYGQSPHLDFPSLWLSLLCFPCHQNFPFECIAPISFQMWWFCPQEQKYLLCVLEKSLCWQLNPQMCNLMEGRVLRTLFKLEDIIWVEPPRRLQLSKKRLHQVYLFRHIVWFPLSTRKPSLDMLAPCFRASQLPDYWARQTSILSWLPRLWWSKSTRGKVHCLDPMLSSSYHFIPCSSV